MAEKQERGTRINGKSVGRMAPLMLGVLLAAAGLGARPKCEEVPLVRVAGKTLTGFALKDGKPLKAARVQLYAAGKIVRNARTDPEGKFTLGRLELGSYRLAVAGVGTFELKVQPPDTTQHFVYDFEMVKGCLMWKNAGV
jgi:Carboxypeptidase regulatory-like domain